MRSLLTRAAAVLAVTFGATMAAQGVALADSHDDPVIVDADNGVVATPVDNDGVLNGNTINVPILAVLDLDNLNVLGVLFHDED